MEKIITNEVKKSLKRNFVFFEEKHKIKKNITF